MERVIDVAKFIFDEYKKMSGKLIDEIKLHKLLYFAQRESIAITNEPLFAENFEGWRYGPVCCAVRDYYKNRKQIKSPDFHNISLESAYIVKNIVLQYGIYTSWKLSELSHNEISWKKSRIGISDHEQGNNILKLEDIRKDAEKIRPYDSLFDMYYDEFEDMETAI